MAYSHFQHRHNFAVWCAARAVQRNFTKTPILKKALELSGVVEFINNGDERQYLSQQDFDTLHECWCDSILFYWEKGKVKGASYGRAAKLLAVYIKSMIVVQQVTCCFSDVAHPPIDRIILHNISKDKKISHPHKEKWKKTKWTQLNKTEYMQLIADFRQIFNAKPLWVIEKYWIIQDE